MQSRWILSLVCGVLLCAALASPPVLAWKLETRWMPLHAKVSVGADGRVTDVALFEDKLSTTVKSMVVEHVKRWQFVPVLVNAVAVPALTYVYLDTCAIPSGDGYDLAVTYVDNGPLLSDAMPLEFSPTIAEYSNKHQSIKIKLRVMSDGRAQLQDVVMVDVAPNVQREVRSTIKDWVRSMRFQPEQIGGQAVATDLEWPMDIITEPLGTRHPNVDVATDPACKSARSGSAAPRAMDSPLKLRDGPKASDANTPAK